jgi:hypothetical protein
LRSRYHDNNSVCHVVVLFLLLSDCSTAVPICLSAELSEHLLVVLVAETVRLSHIPASFSSINFVPGDQKCSHKLRVFENRVLRIIFGPKREKVAGGWRTLNNEKFQNLYASPNWGDQVKQDEMGGACSMHGRYNKCVQNFCWKI